MQGMIPFAECPVGLFESESGELCVKSEYSLHAIIVSTGEKFWGGAKSMHELCKVKVRPVEVEIVRHGRWIYKPDGWYCSVCGKRAMVDAVGFAKRCCRCGAKMDKTGD